MLGNYKPFTITLMGSMPRTPEVRRVFSDYSANRIDHDEYMDIILNETDKVVKLQEEAGIDIITSGEFERDNYMSFVAQKVDGITLYSTDELTAITQHKQEEFVDSLTERDADDNSMNSPAATGKIDTTADFVIDEMRELRKMTNLPLKATVPSPYLLTRNLWVKELTKGHYESRRDLSKDVLKLVRNEVKKLIDFGVEVIQLDEPILAEVCFTNDDAARSFY